MNNCARPSPINFDFSKASGETTTSSVPRYVSARERGRLNLKPDLFHFSPDSDVKDREERESDRLGEMDHTYVTSGVVGEEGRAARA